MSTSQVREQVIETIASRLALPIERITPEASFQEDLKADSLTVAELVLAFEEIFQLRVSDDAAEGLKTVGDAIAYIEAHAGQAG